MITLLIDTSSFDVSIAVFKDDKILASIVKTLPNQHSIYTVSFIEEVLKTGGVSVHDVNQIMVVTGPGSFTGLRIGVTIAKVYAYLENIKVIPISSLKMRSLSITSTYCLSIIDAHHDHYYVGLYDKNHQDVVPEAFMSKDDVIKMIQQYHPIIVSDLDGKIDNILYKKQELDFEKIITFFKSAPSFSHYLINPNYLKLPQVLEKKND